MSAMRRLALTVCAAAVLAWPAAARPHATAAGTTVSGTVSGTDAGFLTGASVTIDGGGQRTTRTDADGRFTFADVARGRYRIQVSADGYLPLDRQMDVADASVSVDIVLLRLPQIP